MTFETIFNPRKASFDVYNHASLHGSTVKFHVPDWARFLTIDQDGAVYAHDAHPEERVSGTQGFWCPPMGGQDMQVATFNCEVKNWKLFKWNIERVQKHITVDFGA